jgi:hypothetical protein
MTHSAQMQAVEDRAFSLRLSTTDALKLAKVAPSTWSRAKRRGYIRASTIRKVEEALDVYAKWKAEDDARRDGQA